MTTQSNKCPKQHATLCSFLMFVVLCGIVTLLFAMFVLASALLELDQARRASRAISMLSTYGPGIIEAELHSLDTSEVSRQHPLLPSKEWSEDVEEFVPSYDHKQSDVPKMEPPSEEFADFDKITIDAEGETPCRNCYVELVIRERVIDGGVVFSLKNIRNRHAYLVGLVPFRCTRDTTRSDYVLTVYGECGEVLYEYAVHSGRFLLWDNFNPDAKVRGGVIENPEGYINIVIPNDERIHAVQIVAGRQDVTSSDVWDIGPRIACGKEKPD
jgi:hypothetical protein